MRWCEPSAFPCVAEKARGSLYHSVLKNVFLAHGFEKLRSFLQETNGQTLVQAREYWQTLCQRFDTFSPTHLVARLPLFSRLPEDDRLAVCGGLTERFAREIAGHLRTEVSATGGEFLDVAELFWAGCLEELPVNELRARHAALQARGRRLFQLLERLPKGIWLP